MGWVGLGHEMDPWTTLSGIVDDGVNCVCRTVSLSGCVERRRLPVRRVRLANLAIVHIRAGTTPARFHARRGRGQTGQLPRASTTKGPPQKTVKNIT